MNIAYPLSRRNSENWQRVSRHRPCPVCGKSDWCLYKGPHRQPEAAICARVESEKAVGTAGAGWLHPFQSSFPYPQPVRVTMTQAPPVDFRATARAYFEALGANGRCILADELEVTSESLDRLRVGWSRQQDAYTFPMRDSDRKIRGIRLRSRTGRKWAIRGSKQGLFIPSGTDSTDLLVICEGPTDTAALLDLGFGAIGRPSCNGGGGLLEELIQGGEWSDVAIIADSDLPGQRGAERLAVSLVPYCRGVRIVNPPAVKDAREWKREGATRGDVIAAINSTPVLKLRVAALGVAS